MYSCLIKIDSEANEIFEGLKGTIMHSAAAERRHRPNAKCLTFCEQEQQQNSC